MRNTRLIDALMRQAMATLAGSPGSREDHDRQRARGLLQNAARHVKTRAAAVDRKPLCLPGLDEMV
ncbi:hypothetical protein ACSHWB_44705 [Lentzea sp. HUAS TT2]|uniref:hypothetical protein n=1 Tax=Lentzea sp. HUAS TT2 TaxID=3447454 RepID=UPI003F72CD16